jgi:hypothetical protein
VGHPTGTCSGAGGIFRSLRFSAGLSGTRLVTCPRPLWRPSKSSSKALLRSGSLGQTVKCCSQVVLRTIGAGNVSFCMSSSAAHTDVDSNHSLQYILSSLATPFLHQTMKTSKLVTLFSLPFLAQAVPRVQLGNTALIGSVSETSSNVEVFRGKSAFLLRLLQLLIVIRRHSLRRASRRKTAPSKASAKKVVEWNHLQCHRFWTCLHSEG